MDIAAARRSVIVASAIVGLSGLTSTAKRAAPGSSSCKRPSCLAASSRFMEMMPVTLPPGWLKLATRPAWTGSPPIWKTIGIAAVAALAACRWCAGRRGDDGNSALNQFGCQLRQPIEVILGPAAFDRDGADLNEPDFAQTLSEREHQ